MLTDPPGNLAESIQGLWWLLSREDWTRDGERRIDPIMGSDPVGILAYATAHFTAQFMKRDRSTPETEGASQKGQNNTSAVGGYDAYFGTYEVDEHSGKVIHTLLGSITPSNVGLTVSRDLRVDDDQLMIQLETTRPDGEPIIRTLIWKKMN